MTRLTGALTAEFLGTLLLVLLGDGVVASVVLLDKQSNWIVITTGWALAVTLGVYLSARLSGGHLNPAVTIAQAVRGEFPWPRVPAYVAVQLAGAVAGALLVYVDYYAAFQDFFLVQGITPGALDSKGELAGKAAGGAGVFATYPVYANVGLNFFSEFLGTCVLMLAVAALTDPRNSPPGANLTPLLVGAVVWAIGLSLGGLTGYAINPARDLGPRLASAIVGWGPNVFVSHNYYFWIPVVAPVAGGVAGGLLYDRAIKPFLPEK